MKLHITTFALTTLLVAAPAFAAPQAMDNMPGMHHDAAPTDVQGIGVVKAIDTAKGMITLQHEAIDSIQWPAMTMAFKVASPELLDGVKIGDKVQFGLHPVGMNSTVTSIKPVQP